MQNCLISWPYPIHLPLHNCMILWPYLTQLSEIVTTQLFAIVTLHYKSIYNLNPNVDTTVWYNLSLHNGLIFQSYITQLSDIVTLPYKKCLIFNLMQHNCLTLQPYRTQHSLILESYPTQHFLILESYPTQLSDIIGTSVGCSSRSAFGWSTGNDVSGHYKSHYWHQRAAFQRLSFWHSRSGGRLLATT